MNYIKKIKTKEYGIEFIEKCPIYSDCNLKNIIPKTVCPFLLHTLVPYYVTYMNDGDFSWVKEKGHVDVQCPNPKGQVRTDVINKNQEINFLIKSSTDNCFMKYKSGEKINISKIFNKICPLVFDIAFPWIQLGAKNPVKLRCPGCNAHKGIKFVLCGDEIENK